MGIIAQTSEYIKSQFDTLNKGYMIYEIVSQALKKKALPEDCMSYSFLGKTCSP